VAFTAVTVKVDELPDVIEAGLALRVTVGGGLGVTVKVAATEALPPAPVTDAV
jgi:hypothetical protein